MRQSENDCILDVDDLACISQQLKSNKTDGLSKAAKPKFIGGSVYSEEKSSNIGKTSIDD